MRRTSENPTRKRRSKPARRNDGGRASPSSWSGPVESLQRKMGNQGVQTLLAERDATGRSTSGRRVPSDRDRSDGTGGGESADGTRSRPSGGATAAGKASVQMRRDSGNATPSDVQSVARDGVRGGGEPLPFRSRLERHVGADALSGIRAHTGDRARRAATAIGAEAYAMGDDVAFRGQPDVKTVAHEVAHVVQQRRGAAPPGGVGRPGDRYERHADAVADAVGRGESAAPLLDGSREGPPARTGGQPASGVVQLQESGGASASYGMSTPASQGPQYTPATRGSQSTPATQGPQSTPVPGENLFTPVPERMRSSPTAERDPTCSRLSEGARVSIQQFLGQVRAELDGFIGWRNGEGWDSGAGDRIPDIQPLLREVSSFRATNFGCEGDPMKGVPSDDPLVRETLFRGVGGQPGLSDAYVNYMVEWLSYAGRGERTSVSEYFGVSPIPIQHEFGVRIQLGKDEDLGGSPIGLNVPGFEVGCFVEVAGGVDWLQFSYSNNLGMRWTTEYAGGDVGVGGRCSIKVGEDVTTSFGQEKLCSGSVTSSTYYGPADFAGSRAQWDVGTGGGGGLKATVGTGEMTIHPSSGKPSLTFDMEGPCAEIVTGLDVSFLEGGGDVGGQIQLTDPSMTNAPVRDTFERQREPMYDVVRDGKRPLLTRNLYYDTGSHETEDGAYADSNMSAIYEIMYALQDASRTYPPDDVEFVVTGHASPRWEDAENQYEAFEENEQLARFRALDARETIYEAYMDTANPSTWPDATFTFESVGVADESQSDEVRNMGSSVGFAETGDPNNNAQRYRRVTVVVLVAHYREQRRNVIDFSSTGDSSDPLSWDSILQ